MNRYTFTILIFLTITVIITGCSQKKSVYNFKDYVVEEELAIESRLSIPKLNDHLIEDYVLNKIRNIELKELKKSKISFKFSKGNLIPVTPELGSSRLTLYNFYGYNTSSQNDVLLGIYEWENYPYNKKSQLDRFLFKIDFNLAVTEHEAMVSYNSSDIESVSLALYNKGYMWDIQKDAKKLPSSGAIYIELKGTKLVHSSLFEYRYNSSDNYFDDTKEHSSTVIIESLLNLGI